MSTAAFIPFTCPCPCGITSKIPIDKYNQRTQRGLLKDSGKRLAKKQPSEWTPHNCKDCGQNCKAPNGYGTQKADELIEITGRRQAILQAIQELGKATTRQIDEYLEKYYHIDTTDNATHSRVSDLVKWKLVKHVDIEGPTQPGDIYPDTKAGAYVPNEDRIAILKKYSWQTWILRAIDSGVSFKLDTFTECWSDDS